MSAAVEILTYQDLIDHATDYLRGNPTPEATRDARRAIISALRIFPNEHSWSYFARPGRIVTSAPYSTGTVEYDHSGHTSGERIITLSDGTWPDWTRNGVLILDDNIPYEVATQIDGVTLQLAISSNPSADVAAGTSYNLFRDAHPLPGDYATSDMFYTPNAYRRMNYVHPREWLISQRYNLTSSNSPSHYTIMGSRDFQNVMEIAIYPHADSVFAIDFIYKRRPRNMEVETEAAGTVTTTVGSKRVTGDSTRFASIHVGSVMRFAIDNSEVPTGRMGANPYFMERMVMSVTDTGELEVDQEFNDSLASVKYTISDPLDIEPGVMATAFLRCVERELSIIRRMDSAKEVQAIYQESLRDAKDADSRTTAMRSVYTEGQSGQQRWIYNPAGPDVD